MSETKWEKKTVIERDTGDMKEGKKLVSGENVTVDVDGKCYRIDEGDWLLGDEVISEENFDDNYYIERRPCNTEVTDLEDVDSEITVSELQRRVVQSVGDSDDPRDILLSAHGELGGLSDTHVYYEKGDMTGDTEIDSDDIVGIELARVLVTLVKYGAEMGVDVERVVNKVLTDIEDD